MALKSPGVSSLLDRHRISFDLDRGGNLVNFIEVGTQGRSSVRGRSTSTGARKELPEKKMKRY